KMRQPVLGPAVIAGLEDTFHLIDEPWLGTGPSLAGLLRETPGDLLAWDDWLSRIEREADALRARIVKQEGDREGQASESGAWAGALLDRVRRGRAELAALAPWLPIVRRRGVAVPLPTAAMSLDEMAKAVGDSIAALETADPADEAAEELAAALRSSSAPGLLDRLRRLIDRADALG